MSNVYIIIYRVGRVECQSYTKSYTEPKLYIIIYYSGKAIQYTYSRYQLSFKVPNFYIPMIPSHEVPKIYIIINSTKVIFKHMQSQSYA